MQAEYLLFLYVVAIALQIKTFYKNKNNMVKICYKSILQH